MGGRDHSLDGLRGLAALVVVVFHFASAYVPGLLPEQAAHASWLTDTPLSIFYNGSFSVAVFFVLSGYVVSTAAASGRRSLPVLLASRYVRLGVPALFSTLLAWALLHGFPDGVHRLKTLEPHPWLEWSYDRNAPGLIHAVVNGAYGVFMHGVSLYNNVLWTMKIELKGSVGIYLVYSLPRRCRRLGIGVFAIFALRHVQYEDFVAGMLMQEFRSRLNARFGWPALVVGVLLGSEFKGFGERIGLPHLALGDPNSVWYVIGGSALVYSVLVLPQLKGLFSIRPLRFLGKTSFPLYLVHVPLLYTAFAMLYGRVSLGVMFVGFVAASLALAMIVDWAVDAPTLRMIRGAQSLPLAKPRALRQAA